MPSLRDKPLAEARRQVEATGLRVMHQNLDPLEAREASEYKVDDHYSRAGQPVIVGTTVFLSLSQTATP
jgi:hypothetical protein